jgi:hypothetical protein
MKKCIKLFTVVSLFGMLSSCSAVAGIFKAGMGFGIFIVVVIVIGIIVLVARAGKK